MRRVSDWHGHGFRGCGLRQNRSRRLYLSRRRPLYVYCRILLNSDADRATFVDVISAFDDSDAIKYRARGNNVYSTAPPNHAARWQSHMTTDHCTGRNARGPDYTARFHPTFTYTPGRTREPHCRGVAGVWRVEASGGFRGGGSRPQLAYTELPWRL